MNRWDTAFANANLLGAMAATAVACLAAYAVSAPVPGRWWIRIAWCFAVAGGIVVLAGTVSRAGLVAVGLGLLVLGCWRGQQVRRWPAWAILVTVVVTALAWPSGWERTSSGVRMEGDRSVATRLHLWRTALAVIADQPWSGCGSAAFATAELVLEDPPPHLSRGRPFPLKNALNDALDLGAKHGLPMLAAVLCGLLVLATGYVLITALHGSAIALAGLIGLLTWTTAGMFAPTWSYEGRIWKWAVPTAIVPLLWCAWRREISNSIVIRAVAWGTSAAMALTILLWVGASGGLSLLPVPPLRLMGDGSAGPPAWGLAPRSAPRATGVWLSDTDESAAETLVNVQRTLARNGWEAWAGYPLRQLPPRSHSTRPLVAIARENAVERLDSLVAEADAVVLLDCPPPLVARIVAIGRPVLLLHGLPDQRGWLAQNQLLVQDDPRCLCQGVMIGRLWSKRFPQLLPIIESWLTTVIPHWEKTR